MNMSASQCSSSGCESGWTLYLDQSSFSKNQLNQFVDGNNARVYQEDVDDGEEEDLSMVSDASSGPPHYCEDDYHEEYCFDDQLANNKKNKSKKKSKEFISRSQHHSYLDDTASSPVLGKKVGKNIETSKEHVLEFSQGFSATHYKGKSSLKKHFGGFFQSSLAEKSTSKEPGGFQGRKWK